MMTLTGLPSARPHPHFGRSFAQDPLTFQEWRSPRPRLSGCENKNVLIHIYSSVLCEQLRQPLPYE
jgi:hypothetical protein